MCARTMAFTVAAGLLISAPAAATIMVPLSIEEMANESAAIVRAKVVSQQAAWGPKHKHIFTYTELSVIESLYGDHKHGSQLIVRSLGGEVGEVGMRVSGTPKFRAGEEVVVLLRNDPMKAGDFQVIGMSQGKYHVKRETTGRAILVPGLEGIAFATKNKNGGLRVDPHAPGPGQVSLVEFKRRVNAALHITPGTPEAPSVPATPQAPSAPATPVPVAQ